jgi:LptD protein
VILKFGANRRPAPRARAPWRLLLCLTGLLSTAAPAMAQQGSPVTDQQRKRILQLLHAMDRDTAKADTLGADTLGADTLGQAGLVAASDSLRAALPALPSDSLSQMLMALKGYSAIQYSGTAARYDADSARIELSGPAQLAQTSQSLSADSQVVFNQSTGDVCGYGKPILQGGSASGGSPVQSRVVCYNVNQKVGVAEGANTKFTEQASWYLHGDLITKGSTRIYGSRTDFTTCDLDPPHYHFSAKELKVIRGKVLVAQNVTLNFADVPVLWLPVMVQSLQRGRQSGLLMPQFSVNDIARTNSNYDRRISNIGFYWAINDYMDARVTGEWFSNNWTSVEGNLSYKWLRQFFDGGLTFRRYWRANGDRDLTLSTQNTWKPDERTNIGVSANYASSTSFIQQNSWDPLELTRSIDSNVGVTRRFDWGTLNLSGQRRQFLSDDRVEQTLPHAQVSIASITLFPAPSSHSHFYNNATLSGSASFDRSSVSLNDMLAGASNRNSQQTLGTIGTNFRVGSFSWNQNVNYNGSILDAKPAIPDTTNSDSIAEAALARAGQQSVQWSTAINYTQRLIGTSTFTPQLQLQGHLEQVDSVGTNYISAPTRLNFSAALHTDLYGFLPGFGPFSRLRHRISPSITYQYSPAPTATPLQTQVFGTTNVSETNQIGVQISQTIEAKFKSSKKGTGADSLGAEQDTTSADTLAADTSTGPRRLPQARKITLLSLNTSAVTYDFAAAKRGDHGFSTTQITNSITSDLLRGLNLSITHDLFRTVPEQTKVVERPPVSFSVTHDLLRSRPDTEVVTVPEHRVFAPQLTNLQASFSVNSDSWLFRKLGLGSKSKARGRGANAQDTTAQATQQPGYGTASQMGLLGPARPGVIAQAPQHNVGTWNATINYSLVRPRVGTSNQQLNAVVSFQPTPNWSVSWRTGYSLTQHAFSDHILSLNRDLHEWEASFDFIKAQNGNFAFQFRVQLKDLPDLHLDYNQRNQPISSPLPGSTVP